MMLVDNRAHFVLPDALICSRFARFPLPLLIYPLATCRYDAKPSRMAFERCRSMVAVKIALGFGRQARLNPLVSPRVLTSQQKRDADEFLRAWPTASAENETHRALDHIRRLGLHASHGAAVGDAATVLRSAIQNGRVSVVIERTTTRSGESGGTGRPAIRKSTVAGPSFSPFSDLERVTPVSVRSSSRNTTITRSWATPSDVSTDELWNYLQSVVGDFESHDADPLAGKVPAPAQLGDAQPFEYLEAAQHAEPFNIAKTPNVGDPGTWYTNPGSGQMRLYGNGGQPAVDIDFDHDHGQGIPHAHNWALDPLSGRLRRGPGVPLSILP
ncbi:hypothetical protein [Burkholderia sp. SCN-KJ]|uniref:hypothetical protein n=1 Tax=Burkholderia sp. SCN-KJ TaxID=2969248 RepID=UPI00214FA462|nr:hypothetical protein [Burkholderia sp. SCN-KJ]MCR4465701.1 hypothetical protein [Burkholderia sp. SCN-KJ]